MWVFDTFPKGSVSAQVEALLPVKNRLSKRRSQLGSR